ncbi:helix-turn-helix domain-containing protein [Micromonospora trifolii]|uniref:helix-turn-helix domain-containing protein n=1 Tax=Micromonospora trifolii TaxID=2911208 RepID=UPI003D2EE5E5
MTHNDTSSAEQRFGAQVRRAREERGWSQEALARKLRDTAGIELHQTAIARLERGERAIRLNEVTALARILDLDLTEYGGSGVRLTHDAYEQAKEQLQRLYQQQTEAREQARSARDVLRMADEEVGKAEDRLTALRQRITVLEVAVEQYAVDHNLTADQFTPGDDEA